MLLTLESKTTAAHKLEQLITRGYTKASEVVDYIMNHQPSDRLTGFLDPSIANNSESWGILFLLKWRQSSWRSCAYSS